jgi:hypothetical protein
VRCQGTRSGCPSTVLTSHDELAVSDVPELGDKPSGCHSDQVGQTCLQSKKQSNIAYILISPNIIPTVRPFIILNSLQKISANFLPPLKLVVSTIVGRHFAQTFFILTPSVKINRSLCINIQLCNHSDRKTTIISQQNPYLFDIFFRFSCHRTITPVVKFNFVPSFGNLHH